jgi:hypothetical protein
VELPLPYLPRVKVLRTNGIEVASIHNLLLENEPQLVFMHFGLMGDAIELAKGLKAAFGPGPARNTGAAERREITLPRYIARSGDHGWIGISTVTASPGETFPPAVTIPKTPHLNFGPPLSVPSILLLNPI